jgi:hypothetical protein
MSDFDRTPGKIGAPFFAASILVFLVGLALAAIPPTYELGSLLVLAGLVLLMLTGIANF